MDTTLESPGIRRNPMERARANARMIGRHLDQAGLVPTADFCGMSKSWVHAMFSENRDAMGRALAFLGLKVVPASMKCYGPDEIAAIFELAKKAMRSMRSADDLTFDEEVE